MLGTPTPRRDRSARSRATPSPTSSPRSALARCRKPTTSSTWRSKPISASCPLAPICRFPSSAKRISAWPGFTINGTTSMPPSGPGGRAVRLARQLENTDRPVACQVFLARLRLAQGDVAGAAAILAEADQSVRLHNFMLQVPDVAAVHVRVLLRQGDVAAAAHRGRRRTTCPSSQARVHLAQGDATAALEVLEPHRRRMAERAWADARSRPLILLGRSPSMPAGEKARAVELLDEALAMAEPGGFVRIFVDEGAPMARLLFEALSHGVRPALCSAAAGGVSGRRAGRIGRGDDTGDGESPGRTPQPSRARGARPARRGADQRGDRGPALPVPAHGEGARPQRSTGSSVSAVARRPPPGLEPSDSSRRTAARTPEPDAPGSSSREV